MPSSAAGQIVSPRWRVHRLAHGASAPPIRSLSGLRLRKDGMVGRNEAVVREAYEAYGRGDVARVLEFVDPELEWTYLHPALENPKSETCRGQRQLQLALERQAGHGLASQIEEIAASGDKVMVVIRTPGIDRVRPPGRGSQFPCPDA